MCEVECLVKGVIVLEKKLVGKFSGDVGEKDVDMCVFEVDIVFWFGLLVDICYGVKGGEIWVYY